MTPKVSVIVPVYESWHLVPNLVECLQRQTIRPDQFEVILVDNGSSVFDASSAPENYVIVKCEKPGSYAARNKGVSVSCGATLVFTDSDCLPEPHWLDELTSEISKNELRAGSVEIVSKRHHPNVIECYDRIKGIPQERYVKRGYAATANLALSADLFYSVGGFDGGRYSGGDAEFCRRASSFGAKLTYVPSAVVNHPARETWKEVVTKARRVKGGQIKSGPLSRRLLWVLRTVLPPVVECRVILMCKKASVSDRVSGVAIELALWFVRFWETIRLLVFDSKPERM